MNKKTMTIVLIVVLILNTFYWLNLIAQIAPEYKPIKTIPTKI